MRHTSSAEALLPSKRTNFATASLNPASTCGKITSHALCGNTVHSSKGVTRNSFASGHVSGVGVPSVLKMLRIRPSWFPSSWTARDSNSGAGGERMASASMAPRAHMSTAADAEVGEVGWAGGRGEEDGGGLDVAVDDAVGVDGCEAVEGVGEDGPDAGRFQAGGASIEEVGEGERHVGKGEDEALLLVAEGLEEGDAWRAERLEDLDLAEGVVRLEVLVGDDDFEREGLVAGLSAEDLGGDAV
ncbi:hypothetical protein MKX08_005763 [Trichoderma sp. CBMAI-0020]|nr:hypothetical protein MKX08_005763 [Trichoderma sp. CBMAI-0020]